MIKIALSDAQLTVQTEPSEGVIMRNGRKRDWYYTITMGMGIVVCAGAVALLLFLIRLIKANGMDLLQGFFLLIPCITLAAGILFIRLSRLKLAELEEDVMNNTDSAEENEKEWQQKVKRRVGILSDTHGLLRQEVIDILKDCDYVIHAGDLDTEEVLDTLKELAPVCAVRGNNDRGQWAEKLEQIARAEVCDIRFSVVHDRKDLLQVPEEADIVIFGHSHKYYCERIDDVLWLNPGSCGKRRFRLPVTMAVLEIGEKGFCVKQHILEDRAK